ncbi:MAG: hypothetical protein HUK10_12795 [Bacteroides heparinolyticus]|nr:hypothetical protein [Bacteroides heparinolyticus]
MAINQKIIIKIREKSGDKTKVSESIEALLNAAEESKQLKRIIDNLLKKI